MGIKQIESPDSAFGSLLPVPWQPPKVDQTAQGEQKSIAMQALRAMRLTGWGLHGSIEGTVETPAYQRLWRSFLSPLQYSKEEIMAMAESLAKQGQKTPLIVTTARDPRPADQGGTEGDLMIIDGGLRFLAAAHNPNPVLECIVKPFVNLYEATLESVTGKLTQRKPTGDEVGMMIYSLRAAHEAERRRGVALVDFPTQEMLAAMLGCSQQTVSKWERLALLPMEMQRLLWSGELSLSDAIDLLPLRAEVRSDVIEEVRSQQPTPGAPLPSTQIREAAQRARDAGGSRAPRAPSKREPKEPQAPLLNNAVAQQPLDHGALWFEQLAEVPAAVAAGWLIHDLTIVLDAIDSEAPEITALRRALAAKRIQTHVQEIAAAQR